jgi:ubiquinone/menaquinone biosynthesis C-methylase UbiE
MDQVNVSKHLKENYAGYYQDGDSEWRRLGALGKVANILDLCQHLGPNKIIEIGAGEGANLKRMSELAYGGNLWAVEISRSGVAAIEKKRIPNLVECKVFDGYHTPYADKQFDLAILSHVLEYVEHPRLLLYEAARIARNLFVEVPLEDTIRLPWDFTFDSVGHIDTYSPRSIRRLLQTCRLIVERQITTNPEKRTYTHLKGRKGLANYYIKEALLRTWPGLATRIFTYHAAILCRAIEAPAAACLGNPTSRGLVRAGYAHPSKIARQ